MALFTDGNIASIGDLRAYESSILETANTEGIELGSKLEIAQREIGLEIAAFLLRRGTQIGAHRELSNVVVTEPLLHAHVLQTLALAYRDAYNSQLNDRYLGKWREYAQLAQRSLGQLFEIGVGISNAPVPKPRTPSLDSVLGGLLPFANYTVQIAWVNSRGGTGQLSDLSAIGVEAQRLLAVAAPQAPTGVAGWHVYAASGDAEITRQTETPLSPGQIWIQPASGLRTDVGGVPQQRPDYYVTQRREWMRG
jgi:hypothetical protein